MTAISHQLNYAMLGREVPILIQSLPRADGDSQGSFRPDTRNQAHGSIRGTDDPLRTIVDINGGIRGVMPCCGIQATGVSGTRVLRKEAVDPAGGIVVPQGAFKSENKGLAYIPQKPLNVAPQRMRDFCNPAIFSKTAPASFRLSQ
jgi:hypothetical protein